jgi:hypothetical protein
MPAKKERNVKKRDPLRRKYGIPTLNDKKRHALRHPGFIAPKPVSHIEENQRRIAELESKLRDKSNGVVVGGTTVGGQVQPQPWVYKKPDAKESDPLSMVTNIAKKLGANSTLTSIVETVGRMSAEDQKRVREYLGQGFDILGQGIGAVIGAVSKPAETEAEKIAKAKALAEATAAASNTTPVKEATPLVAPTPTIVRPIAKPTGLAGVTDNVEPTPTLDKNKDTMNYPNAREEGYQGHYFPPRVPLEENENAFTDSDPNKHDELYLTNASVAQHQNVENKQVESLTPAEIEELNQSSVLPTRYPARISQPTSAAPKPAAQPVDNSEVSNYDYMKTAVLTAITATTLAFRNFLFENPLLAETVQKAAVQGAKTVGDVLPYLRQYINGMPREKIYQKFRSNV